MSPLPWQRPYSVYSQYIAPQYQVFVSLGPYTRIPVYSTDKPKRPQRSYQASSKSLHAAVYRKSLQQCTVVPPCCERAVFIFPSVAIQTRPLTQQPMAASFSRCLNLHYRHFSSTFFAPRVLKQFKKNRNGSIFHPRVHSSRMQGQPGRLATLLVCAVLHGSCKTSSPCTKACGSKWQQMIVINEMLR